MEQADRLLGIGRRCLSRRGTTASGAPLLQAPSGDEWGWWRHARCRGLPTDIFFASDGERGARRAMREEYAKQVCRSCPVCQQCLDYATVSDEPYGIWGAATPRERHRLRGDLRDG